MRQLLAGMTIGLFILVLPYHAADARSALETPQDNIVLHVEGSKMLSTQGLENIIQTAAQRASVGNISWKILNKQKGLIELQGGKVSSYALFDLTYSSKSISLVYKDSRGLKYRKDRRGRPLIHPAYNKWVTQFIKEISDAANLQNHVELITDEQKFIKNSRAKGAAFMVIAAEADPGYEHGRGMNQAKWSTMIMQTSAKAVNVEYSGKIVAKGLTWSRDTRRIARKGYKAGRNKVGCDNNNADRVVSIAIEFDSADTGWHTSRDARYNYYDCKTGGLFSKIVILTRNNDDSFPFEGAFRKSIIKFLKDNGINN